MNAFMGIIYSGIILSFFITTIEITKNKFKKKYLKDSKYDSYGDNEEEYKTREFKPILKSTIIYTILLIITLNFIGDLIGFDMTHYLFKDIFTFENFTNFINGSLYIIVLNSILYLGYIIQIFKRLEFLSTEDKNSTLIFKENFYGPILEEFLYRGIIFNILKEATFSNFQCSLISSLMFGICNIIIKI